MSLTPACLPRVINVNSGCGCTLTRASIKGMTPAEFEALSNKEIALAQVIAESAEAKMLGVPERGLPTLLKSTIKKVKPSLDPKNVTGPKSMILPFLYRRQRSIINASYFMIESGAATPGAGTGDIPTHAWDVVVNLGIGPWKTPLVNIERYFKPGCTLIILNWDDTTAKAAQTVMMTIQSAVNSTAGGVEKATVTLIPNRTATWWAAASADDKKPYKPTFGVVQTGANSVSDWEDWCFNSPSENPIKLLINWCQTTRTTRCIDDVYRRTLKDVMAGKVNPFYQSFSNFRPEDEQNRQAAMLEDREWLRSVWYNQIADEHQTPETYDLLPTVYDPEDATCPLEYKANALGVEALLTECGRMIDLAGAGLDLDFIFDQLHLLKRHREADGDTIDTVDTFTDRHTAGRIFEAMTKYVKARYGIDTTRYIEVGKRLENDGLVMFEFNLYDVPDAGVKWAVFVDEFFNDHLAQFPAATGTGIPEAFQERGRYLWFIDWSDVAVGIAGTNSVTRKYPNPSALPELYKCRMEVNPREYKLRSKKWTVMLDRPYRHLMIQNFSEACPTVTVPGCDVPNPSE